MAITGLEKLYYAKITVDSSDVLTFGTPVYLPGVKEIGITPATNTDKLYAENILWEQITTLDSVAVSIQLADLTNAESAALLGQTVAAEGGVFASEDDIAPYIALLIKANKANGKAKYIALYKGKMELPADTAKGKEGKTEFQTPSMAGTFQTLKNNGMWKYVVDTDDENCPSTIDEDFFADVIVPTKKVV